MKFLKLKLQKQKVYGDKNLESIMGDSASEEVGTLHVCLIFSNEFNISHPCGLWMSWSRNELSHKKSQGKI